jgi:hypothetical protein
LDSLRTILACGHVSITGFLPFCFIVFSLCTCFHPSIHV